MRKELNFNIKNLTNKILIFFISISFFIYGCKTKEKEIKKEEQIPVRVMEVRAKNIKEVLDYVGNIDAENQAIIYPKVNGKVIEKIKEEASEVKKNEPIVYIDRDEVGLKFEKAPVVSTLDGIVGKVFVDLGQYVNTQTPIALITSIDKVKVKLEIPEKYIGSISLGLKAKIKVDAYDKEFLGEVSKVIPVIDLLSRTFSIEITIDNPNHILKPGMFCRVELIIKEFKDALVVLKEAVLGKEPDLFVYVVKNNKAFVRKIKLGLKEGPYCQVIEGLNIGD
ncbi:MAG: efflux RND transporter periplasmic adaptor subunit, partial [Candidatus Aenigmatarchaeota archaeon]